MANFMARPKSRGESASSAGSTGFSGGMADIIKADKPKNKPQPSPKQEKVRVPEKPKPAPSENIKKSEPLKKEEVKKVTPAPEPVKEAPVAEEKPLSDFIEKEMPKPERKSRELPSMIIGDTGATSLRAGLRKGVNPEAAEEKKEETVALTAGNLKAEKKEAVKVVETKLETSQWDINEAKEKEKEPEPEEPIIWSGKAVKKEMKIEKKAVDLPNEEPREEICKVSEVVDEIKTVDETKTEEKPVFEPVSEKKPEPVPEKKQVQISAPKKLAVATASASGRSTVNNDSNAIGSRAQSKLRSNVVYSAFSRRPASRHSSSGSARTVSRSKSEAEEDAQNGGKKKRPNWFIRLLCAIFPCKGDSIAEAVRKIIFDTAVVVFVITGGAALKDIIVEANQIIYVEQDVENLYNNSINGSVNLDDAEIEQIKQEKPSISEDFLELYNRNNDVVGWIKVGEDINYPVVQAADNDYYLNRNFNKEDSKSGSIFADYANKITAEKTSANIVLYGHNMWSQTMFTRLTRYYDATLDSGVTDRLAYYKKNPTLTFNTLYDDAEWKVFACVLFNTEEKNGEVYPYYAVHDFDNKQEFNSFILDIMDRSVLWTDVDLQYGDEILTLSTCYWPYGQNVADTRCAVFARKVREGESAEVDVSKAVTNTAPLKFALQYQIEGGSWSGRTWDTSKLLSYEN